MALHGSTLHSVCPVDIRMHVGQNSINIAFVKCCIGLPENLLILQHGSTPPSKYAMIVIGHYESNALRTCSARLTRHRALFFLPAYSRHPRSASPRRVL